MRSNVAQLRAPIGQLQLTIGVIARSGRVKGYAHVLRAVSGLKNVELPVLALDTVSLPADVVAQRLPPIDEQGMAAFYRNRHPGTSGEELAGKRLVSGARG